MHQLQCHCHHPTWHRLGSIKEIFSIEYNATRAGSSREFWSSDFLSIGGCRRERAHGSSDLGSELFKRCAKYLMSSGSLSLFFPRPTW
jgi:hypothetical protein